MKILISSFLAVCLTVSGSLPAMAQYAQPKAGQNQSATATVFDNWNGSLNFDQGLFKGSKINLLDKDVFENMAKKAMAEYNQTLKDYMTNPEYKLKPYQMLEAMKRETATMAKLLANNPRYKKEVRKQNWISAGSACINGIALGALIVLCAPAAAAYGGGSAAAWFGSSAATGMLATTATISISKSIFVVALLEMFTILGSEIMDSLYNNLTKRLTKYQYLTNNALSQNLVTNAAKGSISNESMVESSCIMPETGDLRPSARWIDNTANEEAIIRLAGLRAINSYLKYSSDKAKYDMALLDIINLFSEQSQVQFDEKVFTRTIVENGEKKVIKNTDIVDVGTGRLLKRTPELKAALLAIQNM